MKARFIALELLVLLFVVLRLAGVTSASYQAFAHLFVGGLFGAAWVKYKLTGGGLTPLVDALFLTLVETLAFFKVV